MPASEWPSIGIDRPVLQTTLNICFQKCATHRVVIWHFLNPIVTETGPEPETEMGLFTFGCSLFAWFSL